MRIMVIIVIMNIILIFPPLNEVEEVGEVELPKIEYVMTPLRVCHSYTSSMEIKIEGGEKSEIIYS
jgi:hypothetical protein